MTWFKIKYETIQKIKVYKVRNLFEVEKGVIIIIDPETRLGEIKPNKHGTLMKIIRYANSSNITIEFQDEHKVRVNTYYNNFNIGQIANPYDITVFGVGYVGEGKYLTSKNGSNLPPYTSWRHILERCYDERYAKKYPAYYGICTVCDEWLNYQNFADWYYKNYYEIGDGKRSHVDKDILFKNNKVYAPDRCLIVPQRINMIFMEKDNKYGLPSGVSIMKSGKYHASYNTKRLGNFEALEDAILAHDKAKEIHIKEVADEFKSVLSPKVYNALYKWKV